MATEVGGVGVCVGVGFFMMVSKGPCSCSHSRVTQRHIGGGGWGAHGIERDGLRRENAGKEGERQRDDAERKTDGDGEEWEMYPDPETTS